MKVVGLHLVFLFYLKTLGTEYSKWMKYSFSLFIALFFELLIEGKEQVQSRIKYENVRS